MNAFLLPRLQQHLKKGGGEGKETKSSASFVQHGGAVLAETLGMLLVYDQGMLLSSSPSLVPLSPTVGIFLFFILWKVKDFDLVKCMALRDERREERRSTHNYLFKRQFLNIQVLGLS